MDKSKFYHAQLYEIRLGLQNGLTKEQVSLYAKPEFGDLQMNQIRLGLERGLSIEKVKIYARPEFLSTQMAVIREALESGLTIDQVKVFARPEYDSFQMLTIFYAFKAKLSQEQINYIALPERNAFEMDWMRLAFMSGLTIEQVKQCEGIITPKFQFLQIREVISGFRDGLTYEQIKFYAKPELNANEMAILRKFLTEHKNKPLSKIFSDIKNKTQPLTKEEKIFLRNFEDYAKEEILKEIKEKVYQKIDFIQKSRQAQSNSQKTAKVKLKI